MPDAPTGCKDEVWAEMVRQKSLMMNRPDYMKAITWTCSARGNVGKWEARRLDLKMLRWKLNDDKRRIGESDTLIFRHQGTIITPRTNKA
jgi:hypothetical protein